MNSENIIDDEYIIKDLEEKAKKIRRHIIDMIYEAGSGHPGGSLSCVDIITVLYFHIMRHNPLEHKWKDRDRFVLSKGHAAPALYAVLAETGYFPVEELKTLRKFGSRLQGHPEAKLLPGIEFSTGSLGQGLSIGAGIALNTKLEKKDLRIYVLLGDGEIEEGQVWEAALFASHNKLGNLTAIIDRNKYQIDGKTEEILSLEPLGDKWRTFGWNVLTTNGHNIRDLVVTFEKIKACLDTRPTVIIANTIKGRGISFMEGNNNWHGRAPSKEEYELAIKEL